MKLPTISFPSIISLDSHVCKYTQSDTMKGTGTYVPLGYVPDTDCSILTIRDYEFVLWVEEHARDVVSVAAHSVHFPGLIVSYADKSHLINTDKETV